jgi:hypothetical protein
MPELQPIRRATCLQSPLAIFIWGRVLDSFSPFPTQSCWSIYVPCGRQVAPPRLNRSAPNHWCMSKGFIASARMRFRVGSAPARARLPHGIAGAVHARGARNRTGSPSGIGKHSGCGHHGARRFLGRERDHVAATRYYRRKAIRTGIMERCGGTFGAGRGRRNASTRVYLSLFASTGTARARQGDISALDLEYESRWQSRFIQPCPDRVKLGLPAPSATCLLYPR